MLLLINLLWPHASFLNHTVSTLGIRRYVKIINSDPLRRFWYKLSLSINCTEELFYSYTKPEVDLKSAVAKFKVIELWEFKSSTGREVWTHKNFCQPRPS